jgi:hypothetical protein
MIRMFSTGLTITTQRLLLPLFFAVAGVGGVDEFWDHFVSAAWLAWIIQLALAEWWVARGTAHSVAAARQPAAIPGVRPAGSPSGMAGRRDGPMPVA